MIKNTKLPLVSVIMPVYNAGKFLGEAIESITNQTYQNFEFIIVDDKSVDSSGKIIRNYQRKYPKLIRTFFLKKNINSAGNGAVNAVLSKAKGKYIARMDADDIANPLRLEKQVKFLEENKEVILVGTQALIINEKGQITGKKIYPLVHNDIYKKYAIVHPIVHPSCMIRRSMLPDKNRLYELKGGVNDDYYSFFRLLNFGKFANLPEFLMKYRIHGANASFKNFKQKCLNISMIRKTAIREMGYKVTLSGRLIIFAQNFVSKVVPEKLLTSLYFFVRGIGSIKRASGFSSKIDFALPKLA